MATAPIFKKTYLHSAAWSQECYILGNGQCDGNVPAWDDERGVPNLYGGEECGCPCHGAWPGDAFGNAETVQQMEAAHREFWHDEEHPTA